MNTFFSQEFKKNYRKRILPFKNLDTRFEERRNLFIQDPKNPVLKDHPLTGKLRGFRAFSITGDIRVIYYIEKNIAYFVDIGTHIQVYK
jgi:addiction module RelE/StbE family toxin